MSEQHFIGHWVDEFSTSDSTGQHKRNKGKNCIAHRKEIDYWITDSEVQSLESISNQ